jgi:DNA uptake protein ComE-like DNA-binding protein
MKSVRKWIRDVFGFSGNEINGFMILLPLMVVLICSEPVYHTWVATEQRVSNDSVKLDSIATQWNALQIELIKDGDTPDSLFAFDPNTVQEQDLRKLGFTEISAKRIAAYRRKGGVFRVKADLLRIYGLDSALYNQLYGYIRLPTRLLPARGQERVFYSPRSGFRNENEVAQKFDLNTADSLLLKSVYGIGSRLAARVIKFRESLGGFVNTDQLFEVYGLDSITVTRLLDVCFIEKNFTPEKININTADEQRLSAHPYVRYKLARLLVSYRFQHGDFREVSDIKKLSAIEPQKVERLLPYLKVKD